MGGAHGGAGTRRLDQRKDPARQEKISCQNSSCKKRNQEGENGEDRRHSQVKNNQENQKKHLHENRQEYQKDVRCVYYWV